MMPAMKQDLQHNLAVIRATIGDPLSLQHEVWLSARLSSRDHEPRYTTSYLLLLKRLSERPGGQTSLMGAAMNTSKAVIAAAADGRPGPDGAVLTPSYIEAQLLDAEGAELRVSALLDPDYPPPDQSWPLTYAGATVSWPFPFSLTTEAVPAAGKLKVPGYVYSVALNATDFVALQALEAGMPLDSDAIALQARLSMDRFRVLDAKATNETFKDHPSVVMEGTVPPAFGKSYISLRMLQARDDHRLLVFVANSKKSTADAALWREKLEKAIKLDTGF
jgi:hypothetical protein